MIRHFVRAGCSNWRSLGSRNRTHCPYEQITELETYDAKGGITNHLMLDILVEATKFCWPTMFKVISCDLGGSRIYSARRVAPALNPVWPLIFHLISKQSRVETAHARLSTCCFVSREPRSFKLHLVHNFTLEIDSNSLRDNETSPRSVLTPTEPTQSTSTWTYTIRRVTSRMVL